MVKIRIEGLPQDVEIMAAILKATVVTLEETADWPNRQPSKFVRRYLTVELKLINKPELETRENKDEY